MRIIKLVIDHYRSIEHVEITMPVDKPLILFGPNNAGKTNILSAVNRIMGERYPSYIEMLDTDYYCRDKTRYPTTDIAAVFDSPLYYDKYGNGIKTVAVRYGSNGNLNENLMHDGSGKKIYPTSEQRAIYQAYLIDAERNIQSAFNYGSQYSLLSKFSHRIHNALNSEHKDELSSAFEKIKSSFEKTNEFSCFFDAFSDALKGSLKGFVHSLAVDFSAYDPNNYAKSLRIYAKEGSEIRGFEEFGTGEQQILLMAFVKAYMQVFTSEHFVLIIEEPEAHLHPLAQKWLKEYIVEMCSSGIQVIVSTHSSDFIDTDCIDGLVRVFKDGNVTRIKQLSSTELCEYCIASGAPSNRVTPQNIEEYYSTKLFPDQPKGFFAEAVILVEGATEYYSLPIYLKKAGFSLAEHGVEIINCGGKECKPLFWRLYNAYGYRCFPFFDGDCKTTENDRLFSGLITCNEWITDETSFYIDNGYAYFGKDFESYFRSAITDYALQEMTITSDYQITSKPGKAKAVAQHSNSVPTFIHELKKHLEIEFVLS